MDGSTHRMKEHSLVNMMLYMVQEIASQTSKKIGWWHYRWSGCILPEAFQLVIDRDKWCIITGLIGQHGSWVLGLSSSSFIRSVNIKQSYTAMQYSGAGQQGPRKDTEKEAWYDSNALHNQSTLQIRKLEKSTLAILDLKTDMILHYSAFVVC